MVESIGSGTARGLIEYLDSLIKKGRMRAGVVYPLKTAVSKVLEETEKENWETVDVTNLDIEDVMSRFKNFTLGDYQDASYRAYELRINRAIKWYKNFLDNPGWYPKESQRLPKTNNDDKSTNKKTTIAYSSKQAELSSKSHDEPTVIYPKYVTRGEAPVLDAIAYPFPLANGKTVRLYMPKGLTRADVKRFSVFLESLVIDDGDGE